MTDQELIAERQREYLALAHAMQSGVAMEMNTRSQPTEPKHLRVGINTAMSDHGALVKLLIDKKIITELEYFTSMCELMRNEVRSYEMRLSEHFGRKVTLG
jgi:hypothetical protein